jgi:hypothetical protein
MLPYELEFEFEEIADYPNSTVTRAKVPGGWLVSIVMSGRGGFEFTTNFVADPEWNWKIPIPELPAEPA